MPFPTIFISFSLEQATPHQLPLPSSTCAPAPEACKVCEELVELVAWQVLSWTCILRLDFNSRNPMKPSSTCLTCCSFGNTSSIPFHTEALQNRRKAKLPTRYRTMQEKSLLHRTLHKIAAACPNSSRRHHVKFTHKALPNHKIPPESHLLVIASAWKAQRLLERRETFARRLMMPAPTSKWVDCRDATWCNQNHRTGWTALSAFDVVFSNISWPGWNGSANQVIFQKYSAFPSPCASWSAATIAWVIHQKKARFQRTRKAIPPNPNPIEWIMETTIQPILFLPNNTIWQIVSEENWSQVMIRHQAKLQSYALGNWKMTSKKNRIHHHPMEQQKWLNEKSKRTERHHKDTLRTLRTPQCLKYAFVQSHAETSKTGLLPKCPKKIQKGDGPRWLLESSTWSFPMFR